MVKMDGTYVQFISFFALAGTCRCFPAVGAGSTREGHCSVRAQQHDPRAVWEEPQELRDTNVALVAAAAHNMEQIHPATLHER